MNVDEYYVSNGVWRIKYWKPKFYYEHPEIRILTDRPTSDTYRMWQYKSYCDWKLNNY